MGHALFGLIVPALPALTRPEAESVPHALCGFESALVDNERLLLSGIRSVKGFLVKGFLVKSKPSSAPQASIPLQSRSHIFILQPS